MLKQEFMNGLISGEPIREKITKLLIEPASLDKWLSQNDGEIINCVEGVLQDNYLVSTRRGIAAIYEHPLNCWSSVLRIEYQAGTGSDVFEGWDRFIDEY